MPVNEYDDPRLAAVSDALDPDRSDLDLYAALATELGARSLLDIGCGTGAFAIRMAELGLSVTGLEPAGAPLEVARAKPGADRVTWLHGDAGVLPPLQVDLATMAANVAQVFLTEADWRATLTRVGAALRPGGHLVLETRDPARRAWEEWTRESSYTSARVAGIGPVHAWCEVTSVALPFVSFSWTHVFDDDGTTVVADSTLRFRSREEIAASLAATGYVVDDVRDAPDRPGREWVFLARRA